MIRVMEPFKRRNDSVDKFSLVQMSERGYDAGLQNHVGAEEGY